MSEKTILVTGASSGIGREISRYLSDQGYSVVALARNEEALRELCAQLGGESCYIPYDLLDFEHYGDIFQSMSDKEIKLDGAVHCAGISNAVPIRANQLDALEIQMKLNCFAFAELGKWFSKKRCVNDGASIIAISSYEALRCDKGLAGYAASKSALNAIVKVMSKEFTRRRIRVNALLPAFVDTSMPVESSSGIYSLEEKIARNQPFGIIPPLQIAYFAEFLLSDRSQYITGSLIPVTGGYF